MRVPFKIPFPVRARGSFTGPAWATATAGSIDEGITLIDFSQQSLTVGTGTSYTNAYGTYTAARGTQSHEAELTVVPDTLTATGWEGMCTENATPGTGRAMRYRIDFSTPLNLSDATNFVLELEYPNEMLPEDFGSCLYVGARLMFCSGSNLTWPVTSLFGSHGISKSRREVLTMPITIDAGTGAETSLLWSTAGGTGADFRAITHIILYMFHTGSNGGFRCTVRKLRVNRRATKALVAFTFDDNPISVHTYALPMFQSAGLKAGVAVIQSQAAGIGASSMHATELAECYAAGWSMYNHMVTDADRLVVALGKAETAYSGGRVSYTTSDANVYAAMTVGESYEIRGAWGPEVQGTLVLAAKSGGDTLEFATKGAPYFTLGSQYPHLRMDYPGESRAARIAAQVTPCTTYLEGLFGAGYRGRTVLVAPGGDYDLDWAADLEAAGFTTVRTTEQAYNPQQTGSPWYRSGGVPLSDGLYDPWRGRCYALDNIDNTAPKQAELAAMVDAAIANGEFLHFMGHVIGATHGSGQVHKDLLQYIVTYVQGKVAAGQVECVTMEEVAARYPWPVAPTTYDVTLSVNEDDGCELNSTWYASSRAVIEGDGDAVPSENDMVFAMSFPEVLASWRASTAQLTLGVVTESAAGTLRIRGESNAAAASSQWGSGNLPMAATMTTAYVDFDTTVGTKTLDVKAIVDEVIGGAHWHSGQRINFRVDPVSEHVNVLLAATNANTPKPRLEVVSEPYPGHSSVVFDGASDYLTSPATPFPDARYFSLAVRFRINTGALSVEQRQLLWASATARFTVSVSGSLALFLGGVGGPTMTGTAISEGEWYTLQIAVDHRDTTPRYEVCLNSYVISNSAGAGAGANLSLSSLATWYAFANASANRFAGQIKYLWVTAGATDAHYVNLAKYDFHSGGTERYLGPHGTAPGIQPLVYYGGDQTAADWNAGTNQGTGADWTMSDGVVP